VTRKTKISLWLFLIGLAAVALIALNWPGKPEPVYNGKTLSEWCELDHKAHWTLRHGLIENQNEAAAKEAVNAIGTNAIPFFLKWINEDEPAWRIKLAAATDKLPGAFGKNQTLKAIILGKGAFHVNFALIGFKLLGTNAAPAVPALNRMMANNSPSGSRATEA